MKNARSAMTLLEVTIATAILMVVLGMVFESMKSGILTKTSIESTDTTTTGNSKVLRDVTNALRYADVNRIYLDGTSWTKTVSGSDYYSFKTATGFSVTNGGAAASLDRVVSYGQGIVLRFASNGDGSGTLYKTVLALDPVTGIPTSTVQSEIPIANRLAWRYTPAGSTTAVPGFQILQLDANQNANSSVIGNQVSVRVAGLTGQASASSDAPAYRDTVTTVFLRSSMYQGVGLLAPVITSPATASGNVGSSFRYDIVATNDPTRFAAAGLPSGLVCDPYSGSITGSPTVQGTTPVVVSATNDSGSGTQIVTMTIIGAKPQITSDLAINVMAGTAVSYQTTATNTPTSYAAVGLPAGLSINTSTGLISGSISNAGNWSATLSATNANGTGSAILTITSTSAPVQPPVVSSGSAIASGGIAFNYQIVATNTPTSFGASGLPSGLSCNAQTGMISGTTSLLGTYAIGLQATNSAGTGTATLSLRVQQPLPVITSAVTSAAVVGASFTYQITATNTPTSYTVSGLPSWATFNTATGMVSGIPSTTGTWNLTIGAVNGVGTGTSSLAITASNPASPSISLANPINGVQNVLLSYVPTVTPAVPTSWTVVGLPSGFTVSTSTGGITGTPKTIANYTVTFTAVNAGGSASLSTVLIVGKNPNAPGISLGNDTGNSKSKVNPTFQVVGTVTASPGQTIDYSSFTWSENPGLSIQYGWPTPPKGSGLSSNQFLITGTTFIGTITASVSDTTGTIGNASKTY
jgi:hypothetical protein